MHAAHALGGGKPEHALGGGSPSMRLVGGSPASPAGRGWLWVPRESGHGNTLGRRVRNMKGWQGHRQDGFKKQDEGVAARNGT